MLSTINFAILFFCLGISILRVASADVQIRKEDFSTDPAWKIFSTRKPPAEWPRVKQEFGWSPAGFSATTSKGQVGGLVSRSTVPAWYAKVLEEADLSKPLKASGAFRVSKNFGNSGVLFGWFNENSRGWRTPNSLVFRIDGNGPGYWIFFEYGTQNGLTAGKGCFEGERYQTTSTKPFSADGSIHKWSLEYDPAGTENRGLITFILDGNSWSLRLNDGHKADGARFNRFGILNQQLSGDAIDISCTELTLNGERIDLEQDPRWESRGSKVEFTDPIVRPFNNAGWRRTARAGGSAGELGGIFWRDDPPAFYATSVGRLTLNDELSASGRICLTAAATDSGVYFGWFNQNSKTNRPSRNPAITQTNSLAIAIEGPSRIGQYFRAACWDSKGQGVLQEQGPIIPADGKPHLWALKYHPNAAGGRGEISLTLDNEKTSFVLPPEMRKQGAIFDHFGFFNFQPDGHYVEVFVDDLEFSVRSGSASEP